ncbi:MAG: cobyrinate a,c-diamide synthase [Hyphomicrobium sp.]|jgi:cobyrinic acid a,c-diamide synthase
MTSVPLPPGAIIAAPRSGAGKTTISLGLMRALSRRGLSVQPFKSGPDYIDPAFHAVAAGRPSYNLDTWAMREPLIQSLVERAHGQADVIVAEGVMGLFDGVAEPGQCGRGATADLAALSGWPVVLVLDVSGQSETAAAIALGCATYRSDVRIAGVILNRVASARQEALIAPAFQRIGMPILGALGRGQDLSLAERHLGLVQAGETGNLEERLDRIADAVEAGVCLDDVMAVMAPARFRAARANALPLSPPLPPPGQRIALACDRAFSFTYPHLVAGWRAQGAEIVPFSPLADEAPDMAADAVWLPGGYPELHAGTLACAETFRGGLKALAAKSVRIHGECGGYMALGAGLEDAEGHRHAMAGLLSVETSYATRKLHLGYRRGRLLAASGLGAAGTIVLGHEFHYASVVSSTDEPLVETKDAASMPIAEMGSRRGSVTGTFFHVIDWVAP